MVLLIYKMWQKMGHNYNENINHWDEIRHLGLLFGPSEQKIFAVLTSVTPNSISRYSISLFFVVVLRVPLPLLHFPESSILD